jgi:Radical SAM superfamily/4Fe-4S single cluster domain
MLPLQGTAALSRGISAPGPSCVVRLRSPHGSTRPSAADFVLVRSREELGASRASYGAALIVSDDELEQLPEAAGWTRLIRIPARFNYFADGDIIGFQPDSRKFRTLYRRASKHNSFLVTDRCNHYCLMCSQPPKNIDDRWLLQEIKAVLPLVDKDTHFLCFTGGEPLLDWREFIEVLAASRDHLPNTAVHVLSNGRAFARDDVVARLGDRPTSQSFRGHTSLFVSRSPA